MRRTVNPGVLRPRLRNLSWERYGGAGAALGALLLLFGVSLVVMEICRQVEGKTNRGQGTTRDTQEYNIHDMAEGALNSSNFYWFWNMPGTFLGTIYIIAGICGLLSARMRTYTSMMTFWIFALIGALEAFFLVASFSCTLDGLIDISQNDAANRVGPSDEAGWTLVIFNLTWSIVLFLLCVASLAMVAAALGLGKTKGSATPVPFTRPVVNRTGYYARPPPFYSNRPAF